VLIVDSEKAAVVATGELDMEDVPDEDWLRVRVLHLVTEEHAEGEREMVFVPLPLVLEDKLELGERVAVWEWEEVTDTDVVEVPDTVEVGLADSPPPVPRDDGLLEYVTDTVGDTVEELDTSWSVPDTVGEGEREREREEVTLVLFVMEGLPVLLWEGLPE